VKLQDLSLIENGEIMCIDCLPKDEYEDLDGISSITRSYLESINSRGDI